jgi:sulfide:quinone oxidoreductase
MPYKCPPAPFEMAFELDDALRTRGVRSDVTIRVLSPAPVPLPVSRDGSNFLLRVMAERDIEFAPGQLVTRLDPASRAALVEGGSAVPYDLFAGVPIHRVPSAVASSGLAPGGWVTVEPTNLETSFPSVYAVGDVTSVTVGGASAPKAGAFADKGARALAPASSLLAAVRWRRCRYS